jgi:glycosyltransferase involved in cell wall biosynthesis
MSYGPALSVIIPTHNRGALLEKSLDALGRQSLPSKTLEVIVVADSCQDDTAARVSAYAKHAPYQLRLLSHAAKSASATRNLGAANARGDILLFLDDDVVAQPGLVQAHLAGQHPNGVVLGYSKPVLPPKPSWFQYDARRWWEDTFRVMSEPGHRFTYRDFFSGNVSLPAQLFHHLGGFDLSFTGRLEDYEFGMRLLKEGALFRYMPGAIGNHHDDNDLVQWLRRIRQEGIADVQIGERHPELRAGLFAYFMAPAGRWRRMFRKLAFAYPQRGDRMERLLLRQAVLCERLRLRNYWQKIVWGLREYNYARGVAATVGGKRALHAWLQEAPLAPSVTADAPSLDLSNVPPEPALRDILQRATLMGLRLYLEGNQVLAIPPQLGAEPLREEHLQNFVRRAAKEQFIPALALSLSRTMVKAQ